jgi:Ca-activated chloride channel family protein
MQTYLNAKDRGFPVLEGGEKMFIPLKETNLTGNLTIPFADLTLTQKFLFSSDEYNKTIEAVYRFPISGNAAVKDVYVRFGDIEIKTRLKKRKKAEKEYEQAKKEGKQATLVSREAPNVFTLRVAGIHPDEPVEIKTNYIQILRPIDEGFEFRLPLTTAPRYVRDDELKSQHSKGEPLALMVDPQHRFSMRITISGASKVTSKTHDVVVKDNVASISEIIPNKDLILELAIQKKKYPSFRLITYREGDTIYFGILASPPETTKKVKKISFVEAIDHSGSMSGAKWKVSDFIAKMTYSEIKELSSEAYIGVFDTNTWWIKVDNRSKLEEFLQRKYGGGGTHLGVAIEEGIHKHRKKDIAYNVIITDAQVSDYGRLFRLADKIRELNQRLIIVCVDSAPNSFIPIEMARRAGGLSFFLSSSAEGDMVNAVEHISRYWREPIGTVEIKIAGNDDLNVEHSQGLHKGHTLELGDLTKNMSRWAVGRIKGDIHPELKFELLVDGKKRDEITLNNGEENKVIKDIFGIHRVNYLECLINARYRPEDLNSLLKSIGYSIKLEDRERIYEDNKLKLTREHLDDLLSEVGLEFRLASKETSFIAVTKREGKIEDTVIVPNALPQGWKAHPMTAPGMAPASPPRGAHVMNFLSPASSKSSKQKGKLKKPMKVKESFEREEESIPTSEIKIIFEGKTKKGIFFESKEKIKLSSIQVLGSVPEDGKIFIYLKNDSTPVATINLERVKLLGERPLNIHGIVRIESNVDGVEVKIT